MAGIRTPRAVEVVDRWVSSMVYSEQTMRERVPIADAFIKARVDEAVNGVVTENDGTWALPANPLVQRELPYIAMDAATRRLWQKHRIVYEVDPTTWAEIGDASLDDVIPAELFTRLPHPDPFVCLPEPLTFSLWDDGNNPEGHMVVRGFFVVGRRPSADEDLTKGVMTSTANGDGQVVLLVGGEVYDVKGLPIPLGDGYQDMIWTRVQLLNNGQDTTLGQMAEAAVRRFNPIRAHSQFRTDLPQILARSVALLTYLCSEGADLRNRPAPPPGQRVRAGRRKEKQTQVVEVGFRYGAALRQHYAHESAHAAHAGGTVRPHVRRGHFHTYRVGKGRTERIVRWLGPTRVNWAGEPGDVTIIKA